MFPPILPSSLFPSCLPKFPLTLKSFSPFLTLSSPFLPQTLNSSLCSCLILIYNLITRLHTSHILLLPFISFPFLLSNLPNFFPSLNTFPPPLFFLFFPISYISQFPFLPYTPSFSYYFSNFPSSLSFLSSFPTLPPFLPYPSSPSIPLLP